MAGERKRRLADIRIERVALVARGANPQADIVFYKSDPEKETEPMTIVKLDRTKLSKEEKTSLDDLLKKLGVTESEKALTAEDILKAHPDVQKLLDDAEAARKTAEETLAKVTKGQKTPEEIEKENREAILKAMPPAAREIIEKAEAAAKAAQEAAAKAIEDAQKASATATLEKTIREESEFAKGYEATVRAYPGKAEDNARLFYRIKGKVSKEDFESLEKMIKAGAEGISRATEESGSVGEAAGNGKAYDQLVVKAEDIRKADPKLTFEKAFVTACEQNPLLVREYEKERRRKDRRRDEDDDD